MEPKTLYQFTLDKEVETEKESKRTNKKTGETTITKRKVKEKKPIEVQIKRPSRRELEEAELEYSIEMSRCIKRGILTKAMLYKKYSDRYGNNIFAVFQTATDWSTHVQTKGKIYNVQERRGSRIQDMMNSEIWLDHTNYK